MAITLLRFPGRSRKWKKLENKKPKSDPQMFTCNEIFEDYALNMTQKKSKQVKTGVCGGQRTSPPRLIQYIIAAVAPFLSVAPCMKCMSASSELVRRCILREICKSK
ncbi:hypothetical protein TNCV_1957601 [Trichonephila clavipes]|nr:hypothetical protein TNCV_1957601 [Trichonephila clavipes]